MRKRLKKLVILVLVGMGLLTLPPFSGIEGHGPAADELIEGFRLVEAASVADAMEQLYGKRAYMSHDMRPVLMQQSSPVRR